MTCPHVWNIVKRYGHCEIDEADPIRHTAVVILGCAWCRGAEAFPPSNAALITERYRAQMRAELEHDGWLLA